MKLFSYQDEAHDAVVVGIRYNINGQERIIKKHLGQEAMHKLSPESIKRELLHMVEADRRKSMATNDQYYGLGVGLAGGLAASSLDALQQQAQQSMLENYATKMFYTNTGGSCKIDTDIESGWSAYSYPQGKIGITAEGLLSAKQMMQGCRRFKFPALNGFSTYDEGAEMKGVDLLRHRCAKWLGTVVAS